MGRKLLASSVAFGLAAIPCAVGCGWILGLDEFVDAPPDAGVGGRVCEPEQVQACYSGPDGTAGVGLCRAGEQTCLADGSGFGACHGEVAPTVEDCATPGDEDCDGVACGDVQWAKVFGGFVSNSHVSTAVDSDGNIVLTGAFQQSMTFGGSPLVAAGQEDVFVAKLDSAGGHVWSQRFGNASSQVPTCAAVDADGNFIVAGDFLGTLDFGGGDLVSAGIDIFVAKLDRSGRHIWSRRFGDSFWQWVEAMAITSTGDIVIAGPFEGSIDFGNGPLVNGSTQSDLYIAKLAGPDGSALWSRSFSSSIDNHSSVVLALDSSNSIYVAGDFEESIHLGGSTLNAAGGRDAFLAKMDADGNHVWSKSFGDAYLQSIETLAIDASGGIFAAGVFSGTVSFGGPDLSAPPSTKTDFFLLKMTTGGNHVWSRSYGGVESDRLARLALPQDDRLFIAGVVSSGINWGGGVLEGGQQDSTLARLGPDGEHVWSKRFLGRGSGTPYSLALAVDTSSGEVVIAGIQYGAVDYGTGTLTPEGGYGVFVAKFSP